MPEPSTRQESGSPLLTEAALENATSGLREAFQERMTQDVENLHRVSCLNTAELITQAYIAGVRDGFVQGAEAQARTREDPDA